MQTAPHSFHPEQHIPCSTPTEKSCCQFKSMLCENLRREDVFVQLNQTTTPNGRLCKPQTFGTFGAKYIFLYTQDRRTFIYKETIRNTTCVLLWVQPHRFVGERRTVDFKWNISETCCREALTVTQTPPVLKHLDEHTGATVSGERKAAGPCHLLHHPGVWMNGSPHAQS